MEVRLTRDVFLGCHRCAGEIVTVSQRVGEAIVRAGNGVPLTDDADCFEVAFSDGAVADSDAPPAVSKKRKR